jgi:pyruvate/2-oxoglutarate dehydrogenase complex dihydrolipoamide acyltransferase (E2) component
MGIRRWIARTALGAACIGVAACSNKPSGVTPEAEPNKPLAVQVGEPLFKAAAFKPAAAQLTVGGAEPVVVPQCQVQYEEKQDVPSMVDGFIELVGTDVGVEAAAERDIITHPRTGKKYRKLYEGEHVKVGQLLAILDDQTIDAEVKGLQFAIQSAEQEMKAAEKGMEAADANLKINEKAKNLKVNGELDVISARAYYYKQEAEKAGKEAQKFKLQAELVKAQVMFKKHEIRSSVNGVVRKILKSRGEGVRATDVVLQIQATDKVRVNGLIDAQHYAALKLGMEVEVEPAVLMHPTQTMNLHRQPVTAVAVTAHERQPLVLSASEDRQVNVWDVNGNRVVLSLQHPGAVRAVACTGPTAAHPLAVTGCDDGKARIYDLKDPAKLGKDPVRELPDHPAGVQAVAFSPDARYCVTAAERDIYLWETATGKKLYAFPAEHRSPVTALHFTPQCLVVSACKDNTVKVWQVGDKGAAVKQTIEHRTGEIGQLGLSPDGGRMLFDQDKSKLGVVSLNDGRTEAVLQNPVDTATFRAFALFSPDESLVLTAGGTNTPTGSDAVLQVWRAPTAQGRASEIRRLVCPGYKAATCAAFSPRVGDDAFLAVGTVGGGVHVWRKPPATEVQRVYKARLVTIDRSVESGGRQLRIRADMPNPADRELLDQSTATLIINPVAPPTPVVAK